MLLSVNMPGVVRFAFIGASIGDVAKGWLQCASYWRGACVYLKGTRKADESCSIGPGSSFTCSMPFL